MGIFKRRGRQIDGTRCFHCGQVISEPPGGPAMAIFSGMSLSASITYPCKSCGAVFCLDCMAQLKQRGTCPRCGGAIGW